MWVFSKDYTVHTDIEHNPKWGIHICPWLIWLSCSPDHLIFPQLLWRLDCTPNTFLKLLQQLPSLSDSAGSRSSYPSKKKLKDYLLHQHSMFCWFWCDARKWNLYSVALSFVVLFYHHVSESSAIHVLEKTCTAVIESSGTRYLLQLYYLTLANWIWRCCLLHIL